MIKKIAFTASTMLFVLAQIFSFFVLYSSHQAQTALVREKEEQKLQQAETAFNREQSKTEYDLSLGTYVTTHNFRATMPENSALYLGEKELYNDSYYKFQLKNIRSRIKNKKRDNKCINCDEERINGKNLLIYYVNIECRKNEYLMVHVQDITYIYKNTMKLAVEEFLLSVLMAGAMVQLLIFFIKKITRPLETVNETQRQLIGSMSHELKTPLTAIKGYSETILHVDLSEEQKRKALNYIYTESGRLSRLSEKMMELTKLYDPECRIEFKKVKIEELFEVVEQNVSCRLLENKIQLVREGEFHKICRNLDQDLMTSFLINLINNSIMASKPGSRIFLGADESSVWVRDEGSGIPQQEVEKVRKAFYRVDKSRSRKSGNMGLGLALCDQIAKIHHGHMEIESQLGKGTKISFIYGES